MRAEYGLHRRCETRATTKLAAFHMTEPLIAAAQAQNSGMPQVSTSPHGGVSWITLKNPADNSSLAV
jgi:hypothetical protein